LFQLLKKSTAGKFKKWCLLTIISTEVSIAKSINQFIKKTLILSFCDLFWLRKLIYIYIYIFTFRSNGQLFFIGENSKSKFYKIFQIDLQFFF
jgi:hypothetical protein